jgi:hypothetical protein
MTPLEAALALIARGWNPVPVEFRSKKPIGSEWQRRVIDRTNVEHFFNGADLNIGVMMGATSRGLTDVDLDCAEAITIAPYILAPTQAVFGRPSKRFSHYLYYTGLAQTVETAVIEFNDPLAKQQNRVDGRLVELRIGGKGLGAKPWCPHQLIQVLSKSGGKKTANRQASTARHCLHRSRQPQPTFCLPATGRRPGAATTTPPALSAGSWLAWVTKCRLSEAMSRGLLERQEAAGGKNYLAQRPMPPRHFRTASVHMA